jgi:hypothetical protein
MFGPADRQIGLGGDNSKFGKLIVAETATGGGILT